MEAVNLKDQSKSVVVSTRGYNPITLDYSSTYVHISLDPLKSNAILAITKPLTIEIVESRIHKYLREHTPACYIAFGILMEKKCEKTLYYSYLFTLESIFNYLFGIV